jgi:S-disulfanyl-L-cysteine oxidoreductase SoxD
MADLSGNGQAAPALAGNEFLGHWAGRSAGDLFDKIRTTMPTGAAGSLTDDAYLDIAAYLLQANEMPAAKPLSRDTLKGLDLNK